jgi:magnesium chelatase subunit D
VRARDIHDLALVPSMVAAATSRLIHREAATRPFVLRAVDLRQYRRRPEPSHALVLILDHSCRGWDPAPALAPHLRWAYESGAAVTVVEFGHRTADPDLCADRLRVPSLLDPAVLDTFDREPGTASPLAHALDLGVHELRRFLRRGRAVVDEALLVVVTDGRGNVPLDASLRGRPPSGVRRQGVDDALRVAATAATLNRLRAVVIAPDPGPYPELPAELAEALGATLVVAPRHTPGAP